MIAEQERNEALAKLAQTQNDALFQQVLTLLRQAEAKQEVPRARRAPPGFAYDEGFWMADDFDEPLEDMKDYM